MLEEGEGKLSARQSKVETKHMVFSGATSPLEVAMWHTGMSRTNGAQLFREVNLYDD